MVYLNSSYLTSYPSKRIALGMRLIATLYQDQLSLPSFLCLLIQYQMAMLLTNSVITTPATNARTTPTPKLTLDPVAHAFLSSVVCLVVPSSSVSAKGVGKRGVHGRHL